MRGSRTWMIYGANGYTGRLIAHEAVRRGERPVLAGRRAGAVEELARHLDLPHRVFSLDENLALALDGIGAVLHAAGPFSATSRPMVDACLAAQVDYLDITGEIDVFEACHARDGEARERGIVLLPGVGFDVVPSDCLAALVARELPGAVRLDLAIVFSGAASGGTSRSMLEGSGRGGLVREDGQLRRVPVAHATLEVPFRDRRRTVVAIPWGDVSTAHRSTGIPNIVTYMAAPRAGIVAMKISRPFLALLARAPVRKLAERFIPASGQGPSEAHRRTARAQLWARVTDDAGRAVSGTLVTPEAYALTAMTAVESIRRVVAGGIPAGSTTPSLAFGHDFIMHFEGCDFRLD
jgi:short subunit dehydrogenase-like uncharacterized protein